MLIVAAALALIALIAGYVTLRRSLRPPANEPDRYAAFVDLFYSQQPDAGEDAWPVYQSLFYGESSPLHDPAPNAPRQLQTLRRLNDLARRLSLGNWDDANLDESKKSLPEMRTTVDAITSVSSKPRMVLFDLTVQKPGAGTLQTFAILDADWSEAIDAMRCISTLNTALMREDASEGRWDEVVLRVRLGRAVAGHSASLPILFTLLVAGSVDLYTLNEAVLCVQEFEAPTEVVDAILAVASSPPSFDETGLVALRGEELAILDTIHGLYDGPRSAWSVLTYPSYRKAKSNIESFFDDAEAWWILDPSQRGIAPDAGAYSAAGLIPQVDLAGLFLPSLRAGDAVAAAKTERAARTLALHLERFEREHGRLPVTLDELPDQSITREPITGDAFLYARTDEEPGYTLTTPESATHVHPNWRDKTPRRGEIPVARNPVTGEPID